MHRRMAVLVSALVAVSSARITAAQDESLQQPLPPAEAVSAAPVTDDGLKEEQDEAPAAGAADSTHTAETAPESPPAASPEPTVVATATKPSLDAGSYSVRLRDLEQRINELKDQVFRSKARLSLLAETALQGVVAGGQAHIVHHDEMGGSYRLVYAMYALDGSPLFNKSDASGDFFESGEFDVYNGNIVPGEHTLTVNLQYQGYGYGIFSYLKGYRFNVSSSYTFTAAEGKVTNLSVIAYEEGGPIAPLGERPHVRFLREVSGYAPGELGKTQGKEEGGQ